MATICTLFLPCSVLLGVSTSSSSSSSPHSSLHHRRRRRLCNRQSSFSCTHSSLIPSATLFQRSRTDTNITRSNRLICCLSVDYDSPAGAGAGPAEAEKTSGIRVVFTGGGTGGHIYPAIAIAEEIKTARPDAAILFVGTATGIESKVVPSAGYDFATVPATRLLRPLISPLNILFPFQLLFAVAASWKVLRKFQPQIVVGTGGFTAAPVCLAAALARIKIVIQEQNSYPGLTTRVIAPYAEKIFLAFNGCVKHFEKKKCLVFGNPVRRSLRQSIPKAAAMAHFFPKTAAAKEGEMEKAQVVLVIGGSTGSSSINIAVLNMYYEMLIQHKNRYIIWQTGTDGFSEMESLVKPKPRLMLTPFLNEMDLAYAAADIVVSRSGAMTCTEILATGKPSILIPLPTSAEDHQTKNAYIMADVAGSKVLTEDELDSSSLEEAIDDILGNQRVMEVMSQRALATSRPKASNDIAKCILSLVELSSKK